MSASDRFMRKLRRYHDDCHLLKRETERAIKDIEFLQGGGVLRYAADFSEIRNYALPLDISHIDDFTLLSTGVRRDALLLRYFALEKLFDPTSGKRILLPSYAWELEKFITSLRESSFYEILDALPQAERFLLKPGFQELAELADELDHRHSQPEEQKRIVRLLEKNAPGILALITPLDTDPPIRLRRLFENDVFERLNAWLPGTGEINEDNNVFNRWNEALTAKRGGRQELNNWLDALAIAMIEQANCLLSQGNTKLLLVTKSRWMHSVFQEELTERLWSEANGDVLRHPLVFTLLGPRGDITSEQNLRRLREMLDMLEFFLDNTEGFDIDQDMRMLRDTLSNIKENWSSAEFLTELRGAYTELLPEMDQRFRFSSHESSVGEALTKARKIISLIANHNELRTSISARLAEIARTLELDHDILGLLLHVADDEQLNRLRARLGAEIATGTLGGTQAMPYRLRFDTPEGQQLIEFFNSIGRYDWVDVLKYLQKHFDRDWDYERLLAMAFLLGTLSKWKIAESYCERAIRIAKGSGISTHEALFFLAICRRKWNATLQRHLNALALLDEAIQVSRDPRYLKEKGTQILLLNLHFSDISEGTTDFPPLEDCLNLFKEAEQNCGDDKILTLQILNNRLFYYISTDPQGDPDKLRTMYQQFVAYQREFEPDETKWPAFILDTVAWGYWVLYHDELTDQDKQRIITQLELALRSFELTRDERAHIEAHRKEVSESESVS